MHQEVKLHPIADKEEPLQQQFEMELTTMCEVIGIFAVKANDQLGHSIKHGI